jgi:hypothetical protein
VGNAIDEGEASWFQLSINAVVEESVVDEIEIKAKAAGLSPSVTDL